jgi:hypothetical protein
VTRLTIAGLEKADSRLLISSGQAPNNHGTDRSDRQSTTSDIGF